MAGSVDGGCTPPAPLLPTGCTGGDVLKTAGSASQIFPAGDLGCRVDAPKTGSPDPPGRVARPKGRKKRAARAPQAVSAQGDLLDRDVARSNGRKKRAARAPQAVSAQGGLLGWEPLAPLSLAEPEDWNQGAYVPIPLNPIRPTPSATVTSATVDIQPAPLPTSVPKGFENLGVAWLPIEKRWKTPASFDTWTEAGYFPEIGQWMSPRPSRPTPAPMMTSFSLPAGSQTKPAPALGSQPAPVIDLTPTSDPTSRFSDITDVSEEEAEPERTIDSRTKARGEKEAAESAFVCLEATLAGTTQARKPRSKSAFEPPACTQSMANQQKNSKHFLLPRGGDTARLEYAARRARLVTTDREEHPYDEPMPTPEADKLCAPQALQMGKFLHDTSKTGVWSAYPPDYQGYHEAALSQQDQNLIRGRAEPTTVATISAKDLKSWDRLARRCMLEAAVGHTYWEAVAERATIKSKEMVLDTLKTHTTLSTEESQAIADATEPLFNDQVLGLMAQCMASALSNITQAASKLQLNTLMARRDAVLKQIHAQPEEAAALRTLAPQKDSLFGPYGKAFIDRKAHDNRQRLGYGLGQQGSQGRYTQRHNRKRSILESDFRTTTTAKYPRPAQAPQSPAPTTQAWQPAPKPRWQPPSKPRRGRGRGRGQRRLLPQ